LVDELGAEPGRGAVQTVAVRLVNHARRRPAGLAEADHHREAVAAADEVARSVERVDEPDATTRLLAPRVVGRLLGNHDVPGEGAPEASADALGGLAVGAGPRPAPRLAVDRQPRAEVTEDELPRLARERLGDFDLPSQRHALA